MDALTWAGVAVIGGAGAVARLYADGAVSAWRGGAFPLGTLVVNLTGALLLGLLTGLGVTGNALELAGTALLGSFTTFSTWMYETHRLAEDADPRRGALNVALGLAAGFLAVLAGRALGTAL